MSNLANRAETSTNRFWEYSALAILGVVAGILVFGVVRPRHGPIQVVAGPGELDHVHDLVLNLDGDLLVAAHTGLYRIDDLATATLIGAARHDLMALATTPQGEFLASGHPDLRDADWSVEGKPPFMGLARSTDSGFTWQPSELLGDVDFHALAPVDETAIIGGDSEGNVWFGDGRTWEARSQILITDLAVSPTDPSTIAAVVEENRLVASSDQGRTWQNVPDAPPLAVIDWPVGGAIVGARPDGVIYSAPSLEGTWAVLTNVDSQPEAVLAIEDHLWVAVEGGRIFHLQGSDDWQISYQPPGH